MTECLQEGALAVGAEVSCAVDYEERGRVAPNHTMTHMLNFALRKVLGAECDQKGCVRGEGRGGRQA